MKNFTHIFMILVAIFSFSFANAKSIELEVTNEKNKQIKAKIPFDPKRVVVLNHTSLDILDAFGLGDRVVGMVKNGSIPEHLKKYGDNKNIVNIGGYKEQDMEAIMSLQPDIIFSSDRVVPKYKEYLLIAPTVASYIDYKKGFNEGFKENLLKHAKIFAKEKEAQNIIKEYDKRIDILKQKATGKTAILGIFTGGSLKVLGDNGRVSIITTDIGFKNIANKLDVNHGNTVSYEFIVKENPEYLFILDKDRAVGENTTSAKELLDNKLIKRTKAYKNGKIIFLEPDNVWYIADGGIKSMDIILKNIEDVVK